MGASAGRSIAGRSLSVRLPGMDFRHRNGRSGAYAIEAVDARSTRCNGPPKASFAVEVEPDGSRWNEPLPGGAGRSWWMRSRLRRKGGDPRPGRTFVSPAAMSLVPAAAWIVRAGDRGRAAVALAIAGAGSPSARCPRRGIGRILAAAAGDRRGNRLTIGTGAAAAGTKSGQLAADPGARTGGGDGTEEESAMR